MVHCAASISVAYLDALREVFDGRIISCVPLTPFSPNLKPCDFICGEGKRQSLYNKSSHAGKAKEQH